MQHNLRPLALAAAAVLAVSACGTSDSTGSSGGMSSGMMTSTTSSSTPSSTPSPSMPTPAAGDHNDADVAFATGMIPHHRQAVQMADMAATRASSPNVKDLAARIKAAQAPEIAQMSGWLTQWGAPVPTATGMGSMDHSSGDMSMDDMDATGMMSDEDLAAMGKADGTAFDVMFLTGMTAHHKGAIAMAKTELAKGADAEAQQLARAIITGQSKEITQMAQLLIQAKS
jgi:uncharacterized protein (DUF305 family)